GSSKSDDYMAPHVLAMSATPIPRSLALALYGDMSLTQAPSPNSKMVLESILDLYYSACISPCSECFVLGMRECFEIPVIPPAYVSPHF
ncbi:ATP-dependent DNA helicase RecG, partial [Trifolium medium]|nr:ATP-dependent DNA helicase RecG [Trifolium medium]